MKPEGPTNSIYVGEKQNIFNYIFNMLCFKTPLSNKRPAGDHWDVKNMTSPLVETFTQKKSANHRFILGNIFAIIFTPFKNLVEISYILFYYIDI